MCGIVGLGDVVEVWKSFNWYLYFMLVKDCNVVMFCDYFFVLVYMVCDYLVGCWICM